MCKSLCEPIANKSLKKNEPQSKIVFFLGLWYFCSKWFRDFLGRDRFYN